MAPIKQNLPKLPLPPLKQTLERLLTSARPFLSDAEYKVSEGLAQEFSAPGGVGEKLQGYLEHRVETTDNWLAELWLNHAYMEFRAPLPVFNNTGNIQPRRTSVKTKADQLAYAAAATAAVLDHKARLYQGKYPVQKMGPHPLNMEQYYHFLGSYRVPGEKRDSQRFLEHDNPARHIAVVHNYHFFAVPVYDEDGKPLNQSQLLSQLEKVVAQSPEMSRTPVGIFTTEHRDEWYKIYTELKKDAKNAENLELIASSLFLLCIDGPQKSEQERNAAHPNVASSLKMWHGGGFKGQSANRWFDKGVQIVVGEDGEMGCPFEHSMGEGDLIGVLMDHIEDYSSQYGVKNDPVAPANKFANPHLLQFNISDKVQRCFSSACENIDRLVEDTELHTFELKYGKGFIKTQKVSPDSFVQMAIQYAFYKHYNVPGAQYESAATRLFQHGRTETIRSCSIESVHFARTMLNPGASNNDKAKALRDAIAAHKKYVSIAIEGQGVDRHLLGLRLMAAQHGMQTPRIFEDAAYTRSGNMRLSTSQVPNRSGSYGFFGPLARDGYGCCYVVYENNVKVAVTAFKCKETSAKMFAQLLESCLYEMKSVMIAALVHHL